MKHRAVGGTDVTSAPSSVRVQEPCLANSPPHRLPLSARFRRTFIGQKLQTSKLRHFAVLVGCAFLLAGCDAMPLGQRLDTSFTSGRLPAEPDSYTLARAAAENGNFPAAIGNYERVLSEYTRGKDGAEVRLEFAKVLLYAEMPDRALAVAEEARGLTRNRSLRGRADILAAIAQHSRVERYLANEPPYEPARDRARSVYELMVTTYEDSGRFDAEGIIPARLGVLRESLAKLEIRQIHAERASGDIETASQRALYVQFEFADTDTVRQNAQLLNTAARRA